MNLPNKITISRIVLVPIFMLFVIPFPDWVLNSSFLNFIHNELVDLNEFIKSYGNYIAALFFIIASATDGVDGYIARKRKQVTTFGKFLDPIADKLLTTAALIALVQRQDVTGWAAMLIIGRDLVVTGIRLLASGEGIVISASYIAKLKTTVQMIAIAATLLLEQKEQYFGQMEQLRKFPIYNFLQNISFDRWAMLVAVLITLYSMYDYMKKNLKLLEFDKM